MRFHSLSSKRTPFAMASVLVLVVVTSHAQAAVGIIVQASVSDTLGGAVGSYTYQYTLTNQATCVRSCSDTYLGESALQLGELVTFDVPYFGDSNITAITSPAGWTAKVEDLNQFNLEGAMTLRWSASFSSRAATSGPFAGQVFAYPNGLPIDQSLGGFGYTSTYAPGKGPFQVTSWSGGSFVGDPAVPLSPSAVNAGLLPVPEPASAALLLAGLAGVLAVAKQRRASAG